MSQQHFGVDARIAVEAVEVAEKNLDVAGEYGRIGKTVRGQVLHQRIRPVGSHEPVILEAPIGRVEEMQD